MNKWLKIGLISFGVLILLIAGLVYYLFFMTSTTKAFLYIEKGTVEVNSGAGFKTAQNEMELSAGDIVKTGSDGKASVIFYESDVMELDSNTEIKIDSVAKNNIAVSQNNGQTWNRVEKIAGKSYSIKTPTSVATVRGTGFGLGSSNGEDSLIVGDGSVNLNSGSEDKTVGKNQKLKALKNGKVSEEQLSDADKKLILENINKDIANLQMIRERELAKPKNKWIVDQVKERTQMSDEQLRQYLVRADNGEFDLDALEEKLPVKNEPIMKFKGLTQRIIELKKQAKEYEVAQ